MTSKFSAMQKQLERAGGSKRATVAASAPEPVAVAPAPAAKTVKAPSREGKIHIGAYLHPDFKRSLRMVQAQTGMDIQALIALALNDLFRGHNVPVIDQE
ncbi:MAG TPA: ribbon-helix-helix domain-containing protein [Xanthobacteraceae bacterium]|jgi:hypothetical protein|nr:ribbon-helix-helix domain-containing protein [Xanthobacteraceae bacterium]